MSKSSSRPPASPFRLSTTIEASSKFAAENSREEPVSIACVIRGAFASFSNTAIIAEVSMTITAAGRARHNREFRQPSAYRDQAGPHIACRFQEARQQDFV